MVLVSHEKEFIFLKTSKTAGTSVEMVLEPFCAPPNHQPSEKTRKIVSKHGVVGRRMIPSKKPSWLFRWQNRWAHHDPAAVVQRRLGKDRFLRYTKVSVARNPFDRAVSQF
jgi:hypothetical protein